MKQTSEPNFFGGWQRAVLALMCCVVQVACTTTDFAAGQVPRSLPMQSVEELAGMLRAWRPSPERVQQNRVTLATEPSKLLRGLDLGDFYVKRGFAARALGEPDQAEKNFRLAIEAYGQTPSRQRYDAYQALIMSLRLVGKFEEERRIIEIASSDSDGANWQYVAFAKNYANLGQRALAYQQLDKAKQVSAKYQLSGVFWNSLQTANVLRLESELDQAFGSLSDALANSQKAVEKLLGAKEAWSSVNAFERPPFRQIQVGLSQQLHTVGKLHLALGSYGSAIAPIQQAMIYTLTNESNGFAPPIHAFVDLARAVLSAGRPREALLLTHEISVLMQKFPNAQYGNLVLDTNMLAFQANADLGNHAAAIESAVIPTPFHNALVPEALIRALLMDSKNQQAKQLAQHCLDQLGQGRNVDSWSLLRYEALLALASYRLEPSDNHALNFIKLGMTLARWYENPVPSTVSYFMAHRHFEYVAREMLDILYRQYAQTNQSIEQKNLYFDQAIYISDLLRGASTDKGLRINALATNLENEQARQFFKRIKAHELEYLKMTDWVIALGRNADERSARASVKVHSRLATLRDELNHLRSQLRAIQPDYERQLNWRVKKADDLIRLIRPKEALLMTQASTDSRHVFLLTAEGAKVWRQTADSRVAFNKKIGAFLAEFDPSSWNSTSPPEFSKEIARDIFQNIFPRNESVLKGINALTIVADNELAKLPFSALMNESSEFLVNKWAMRMAASATSFYWARSASPKAFRYESNFVGFGDPVFSNRPVVALATSGRAPLRRAAGLGVHELPHLPDTRDEIHGLANSTSKLYKGSSAKLFFGSDASLKNVTNDNLRHARIIAFATHGLGDGDVAGLHEPALALSPNSVLGDDGLLTSSLIATLELAADWVLLSACNTADLQGVGSGASRSLTGAFLGAGARSVLATNWAVDSVAAAQLTTMTLDNYAQKQTGDKAEALQLASQAMSRSKQWAHPYYWAAYTLFGE